jgi:hypothetical protein
MKKFFKILAGVALAILVVWGYQWLLEKTKTETPAATKSDWGIARDSPIRR